MANTVDRNFLCHVFFYSWWADKLSIRIASYPMSCERQTERRPVIDAVYPFADAISAFRHLERGAFGKAVIRVQARSCQEAHWIGHADSGNK